MTGPRHAFRTGRDTLVAILLLLLCPAFMDGFRFKSKVEQGNRAFAQGRYDEALQAYIDAAEYRPGSALLRYNIGCVHYEQERIKDAEAEFHRVLRKPAGDDGGEALRQRAVYNLGICLFKQEMLAAALEAFKEALRIDHTDMDAKHNLELVQELLDEQNKAQPPPEGSEENQPSGPGGGSGPSDEDRGDDQKQESRPSGVNGDKERPAGERPAMGRDDAERILNALEESEREARKARARRERPPREEAPEIDW